MFLIVLQILSSVNYMENNNANSAYWKYLLIGALAGTANGIFGAGGGLFLVPLFIRFTKMEEQKAFATSVAVILPLSVASLIVFLLHGGNIFMIGIPFLLGGIPGGWLSGKIFHRVPTVWLHRLFGILILYGAVRTLFF